MRSGGIFHRDFEATPFWWQAYKPQASELRDLPRRTRVAIVGSGYAGLCAAIELQRLGLPSVVLDAHDAGFGGSTRNGGLVSGGVSIGKRYSGQSSPEDLKRFYTDAADSFSLVERIIAEEAIDCDWTPNGSFTGAWTPAHYRAMDKKSHTLNDQANLGAHMLPHDRQRAEIGSDYYHGGLLVDRGAHLHPAKYYKGLLDSALRRGVTLCAQAPVTKLTRQGRGWRLTTGRGEIEADDVIIATNGYTGDVTPQFKRRLVPFGAYIIATEPLPEELRRRLLPTNRAISDSRRILTYYRLSGDRLIFGGRAKFTPHAAEEAAPILHGFMTDRFPELKGTTVTHAWTGNVAFTLDELPHMGRLDGLYYALGCNGSGIAMMSYLGTQTARKLAGAANARSAFDQDLFPTHPLYRGRPWFLPILGPYFKAMDWLDRKRAG